MSDALLERRPEPPGFGRAVGTIAAMTVAGVLKKKRLIFLVALLATPVFIAIMMKSEGVVETEGFLPVFTQAFFVVLAPLVCYFQGMSLFAEEVDNRTMGYLLMRPISRDAILFGKFVGATLTSFVFLLFSSFAFWSIWAYTGRVSDLASSPVLRDYLLTTPVLLLACALYTAFAITVALHLKHPMLFGSIYLMLIEIAFCNVPGPAAKLALSHYLTRLAPDRWITPDELVGGELGMEIIRPDRVMLTVGLLVWLAVLLIVATLRLRATDFSDSGEE
ncbi:MAG: ABC transporter permease [Planctomycetes bacterium]|nr:ABC transporter permease [Planctomycetota bacterium]